jgi:hypothetical protein
MCSVFAKSVDSERQNIGPISATEKLQISSGLVLFVDQYMLANSQFLAPLQSKSINNKNYTELAEHLAKFGALVVPTKVGVYDVSRDPVERALAYYPENSENQKLDDLIVRAQARELLHLGKAQIYSRCMVILDISLVQDKELLQKYRELRQSFDEKKARDLLRENGAAVRYGFNFRFDTLEVFVEESNTSAILLSEN